MAWFGFWIFLAVCIVIDAYFYNQGHDGLFFEHKTDAEKEIQKIKISRTKQE